MPIIIVEAFVRQLRDNVYCYDTHTHITNENWNKVKENWLKQENVDWLLNQPQNAHLKKLLQ